MKESHYDLLATAIPRRKLSTAIDLLAELGVSDFKVLAQARKSGAAPDATAKKEPAKKDGAPTALQLRNAILDAPNPKDIRSASISEQFPQAKPSAVYGAFADLVKAKLIRRKERGVYAVTSRVAKDADG
jgi:DNA-directed RNA polymerase